ncbi:MAG: hypothetical protein CMG51_03995 [Candidatus Marinimicrobia bacterium]|nr:hypothetical protein [Candidatus Neomarinimicrobiota bacterium]
MELLIKQEKIVLKFLSAALTLGVLAMAYKNTLLKTGPIPKEIQQAGLFQADANSDLLEHSGISMTVYTNAVVEKRKESSQILVNINASWKGELGNLPSIGLVTFDQIIG